MSTSSMNRFWGGCVLLGVTLLLSARYVGNSRWAWAGILLASTAYVATAVTAGARRSAFGRFVLAALVCCFVSDIIGPGNFEAGVWGFLAAHVFLIASATQLQKRFKDGVVGAAVLLPPALVFLVALMANMPVGERFTIVAYTATITTMGIFAWSARRANRLLWIGAAVFFLSDIFVGLWRYTDTRLFGFICYPLYYASCYVLGLSVKDAVAAPSTVTMATAHVSTQASTPMDPR